MTSADKSPCTREVRVADGNRWTVYVAKITGEGVYIREKGRRTTYGPVSWGAILLKGGQMAALAMIEERGPRRKRTVKRGAL